MKNIVYDKSFAFAIQIVQLCNALQAQKKEYIMSQILRAGTSIGANIKEAQQGESRKDFIHKMNIALKEASETEYWLELLIATKYTDMKQLQPALDSCKELNRILTTIVKNAKQNKKIL